MKQKQFLVLIMIVLLFTPLHVSSHGDEEHSGMKTEDHCENSSETLLIKGGGEYGVDYDKDTYQVSKDTCIKFIFQNLSPSIEHDVNIDEVEGEDGIQKVHLHLFNNSDGPNNDGKRSQNVKTPDTDAEFEIYCTIEGHAQSGMTATLVVGDGSSSGSVSLSSVYFILPLVLIPVLARIKREKNK